HTPHERQHAVAHRRLEREGAEVGVLGESDLGLGRGARGVEALGERLRLDGEGQEPEGEREPAEPHRHTFSRTGTPSMLSSAGAAWYSVSVRTPSISPCSAGQRSASMAAMQPVPAAVTAWR